MKPLTAIIATVLIGVVVAGIFLRFVGGGADTEGAAQVTDGTSVEPTIAPNSILVTLASSSTKRDWLDQVLEQFNAEGKRTANGETIRVEASHVRSGSSMNDILEGELKPVAWSPGDQSWEKLINETWRQRTSAHSAGNRCTP